MDRQAVDHFGNRAVARNRLIRATRAAWQLRIGFLAELLAFESAVEMHQVPMVVVLALARDRPFLQLPFFVDQVRRQFGQHHFPARHSIRLDLQRLAGDDQVGEQFAGDGDVLAGIVAKAVLRGEGRAEVKLAVGILGPLYEILPE